MAKKRDAYVSAFDGELTGVRMATYDVTLALWLLEKFAKQRDLLDQHIGFDHDPERQTWSLAELLKIAQDALNDSISPVADVYERLRQNEEATRIMAEAWNDPRWRSTAADLARTLDNQALVRRGYVSQAKRDLATRKANKEHQ